LTVWPSAQWYSYFGPADMMGQLSSVQKLSDGAVEHVDLVEEVHSCKKNVYKLRAKLGDVLLTATHSLRSSPSGSITASRKLPEPKVAAACFISSY
jgi:hypothetical protein